MDRSTGNALVTEIAADVLADIAPQELAIFQAASAAYFSDPGAAQSRLRAQDNILGFGDPLTVLATPVVLYVLSETLAFLVRVAQKAIEDGIAHEVTTIVRSMFAKFGPAPPGALSLLTKEQVGLIHAQVLTAAQKLRLPPPKAASLADAVVAQLVVPKS